MASDSGFRKAKTIWEVKEQAEADFLPYGDPRYVDLNGVRGRHVVDRFKRFFSVPPARCVHIAYAGHRGSGKTTELSRVRHDLEQQGAYVVYSDAYERLHMGDLDYTDILLFIAQAVLAQASRDVDLPDGLLEPVEEWFAETTSVTREEIKKEIKLAGSVGIKAEIPFLANFLLRVLSRIKGSVSDAKEIRSRLLKRPDDLIRNINVLLSMVTERVADKGGNRLVLMLDSLDRFSPDLIEKAFIANAAMFTRLNLNLILTVPLHVVFMPSGSSMEDAGFRCVTLPMVPVRSRGQSWSECDEEAVSKLEEVVRKRVEAEVFTDETAVRDMALMSGGSLRELMRLLYEAALEEEGEKITRRSYEQGRANLHRTFSLPLTFKDLDLLRDIHCAQRFSKSPEEYRLLFHRFALEYNGEGWFDVHPLIYHSGDFQRLLREKPCA